MYYVYHKIVLYATIKFYSAIYFYFIFLFSNFQINKFSYCKFLKIFDP